MVWVWLAKINHFFEVVADLVWRLCSPKTTGMTIPTDFKQNHGEGGAEITIVGVYGPQSYQNAKEINYEMILPSVTKLAADNGTYDFINSAFFAMKNELKSIVAKRNALTKASNCILLGCICGGKIHVAGSGPCRVVIGCLHGENDIVAEELSSDLISKGPCMRKEGTQVCDITDSMIKSTTIYPGECGFLVTTVGFSGVEGYIQICRDMGYAVPKSDEVPLIGQAWHNGPSPFGRSHLAFDREVHLKDRFLIFASESLWMHVNIQEAVEFVHSHERDGLARKLAGKATEIDTRVVIIWLDSVSAESQESDSEISVPLPTFSTDIDSNWPILDDSEVEVYCSECKEHIEFLRFGKHVKNAHRRHK